MTAGGDGVRAGVLGGTFDPPHQAHLALAAAARAALRLERVILVPAGDPWRRTDHEVSPAADRLALARAAAADLPWVEVSSIEVDRPGPSYSVDTIAALAAAGGSWWFIMGEDALLDLPHWHDPQRLLSMTRLAVARRGDSVGELVTAALQAALPGIEQRVDPVPMRRLAVSATEIRALVRAGRPTTGLMPDAVRAEIDARGLYR